MIIINNVYYIKGIRGVGTKLCENGANTVKIHHKGCIQGENQIIRCEQNIGFSSGVYRHSRGNATVTHSD